MKNFKEEDIIVNKIKAHPKIRIFCHNGNIYLNNTEKNSVILNDFLKISDFSVAFITEDGFYITTEDGLILIGPPP